MTSVGVEIKRCVWCLKINTTSNQLCADCHDYQFRFTPSKDGLTQGFSVQLETPDGKATIFITHKIPLQVDHIDFIIGKTGSSVAAWANALAKTTLFALRETSLEEVIALLSDISTDRIVRISDKQLCRSGPEALAIALRLYRDGCYRDLPGE